MSNDMIPSNIQVPAHVAARMGKPSALAASIGSGLGGGDAVPRISIKASRFRIVEDGVETVLDQTSLDVVIVGANPRLSKNFYAKAYDPDAEPTGPDCYSMDGVRPDPSIANPVNDLCATCPNNAWGSKIGPQGQELKLCADQKRLAIVAADDPEGPIYLLQVTPAALKGLKTFQKELVRRGIPPETVKTRIGFDTNASFPKLVFKFGGFLDAETQAVVDPLFDSPEVRAVTAEFVGEVAATTAAPKAAAAPAPEPEAPKRGFGGTKAEATAEPEAPKRGFGGAAKAEPKVAEGAGSLSDEIAAMLSGGTDD
jgi:hypothetical protein